MEIDSRGAFFEALKLVTLMALMAQEVIDSGIADALDVRHFRKCTYFKAVVAPFCKEHDSFSPSLFDFHFRVLFVLRDRPHPPSFCPAIFLADDCWAKRVLFPLPSAGPEQQLNCGPGAP